MKKHQPRARKPKRRDVPGAHGQSFGPTYQVVAGGGLGCRFCVAFRELAALVWPRDRGNTLRVQAESGCFPALPGPRYVRIERGDEYSLFQMIGTQDEIPALWFRNSDMRMDGSNTR